MQPRQGPFSAVRRGTSSGRCSERNSTRSVFCARLKGFASAFSTNLKHIFSQTYSEIRGNLVDFFFGFAVFSAKKRCKGIEKSQNSGLVQSRKCKARKTLKNDALDAKIGVDTAANEPRKGSEILKTRKNGRPNYRRSDSTTFSAASHKNENNVARKKSRPIL